MRVDVTSTVGVGHRTIKFNWYYGERNLDKLLLDGGGTRQTGDSYAVRKCGFTRKASW